jgi:hypothetical protein
MMDKRQFIIMAFAKARPSPAKFRDELDYARAKADFLVQEGLLNPDKVKGEKQPRKSVDYLARLEPDSRAAFLAWWKEYNRVPAQYKAGDRNEAACAWGQLNPDEALAQHMIEAAKADAAVWRDSAPAGARRMWGQGWINNRRFDAYEPPASASTSDVPAHQEAHRRALADVRHWERLANTRPNDPVLQKELAAAREHLATVQRLMPVESGSGNK